MSDVGLSTDDISTMQVPELMSRRLSQIVKKPERYRPKKKYRQRNPNTRLWLLFAFYGRINRSTYLCAMIPMTVFFAIIYLVLGVSVQDSINFGPITEDGSFDSTRLGQLIAEHRDIECTAVDAVPLKKLPVVYTATNLPYGFDINKNTGLITGKLKDERHVVKSQNVVVSVYNSDNDAWLAKKTVTLNFQKSGNPVASVLMFLAWAVHWSMLWAVQTKRWHDRGKSGWWSLMVLLPVIGWLWMLIESTFGKGDENCNEFGAEPNRARIF
jgi:uncharacterized membrane protein YhaH (DUF805 family)